MIRFKKEYRPICGQKWWEKIIDVVTREYPLNKIETIVNSCVFFGVLAVLFLVKVVQPQISRRTELMIILGVVALLILWHILCVIEWIGNRVEKSVKRRVSGKIEQYVTAKGFCSYDELISAVMKVRIHRGFDEALEKFESERKLAFLDGVCRVPTDEDKRRWRDDDVDLYGVSFEELEQVFAHPLEWFGGKLRIEFSVWEDEVHRLEKEWDAQTDVERCVCTVADGTRWEFPTFAELADAPIFDGHSLREVCDQICVSYANDYDWTPDFFEVNCTDS